MVLLYWSSLSSGLNLELSTTDDEVCSKRQQAKWEGQRVLTECAEHAGILVDNNRDMRCVVRGVDLVRAVGVLMVRG